MNEPLVLVVAGLDPSAGSGLIADVDAVRAAGGRPAAVCAALTAQGGRGVQGVLPVFGDFVTAQINALDPANAVKTGMLGTGSAVEALLALLDQGAIPPPVVDPVVESSSGHALLDRAGAERVRTALVPLAAAVTPNLDEAAWLTGREVETPEQMEDAARALTDAGCALAVITGGHLRGDMVDVVMARGSGAPVRLPRQRVPGTARGTGCRFASFLATCLARGDEPVVAAQLAGDYVARHVQTVSTSRTRGPG